jgi:hypothetical protein
VARSGKLSGLMAAIRPAASAAKSVLLQRAHQAVFTPARKLLTDGAASARGLRATADLKARSVANMLPEVLRHHRLRRLAS